MSENTNIKVITFGSYPQTLVTDSELIKALSESDDKSWSSNYRSNYCNDSLVEEYKLPLFNEWEDIDFSDGHKYRRIKTEDFYNWYRFEPVEWQVLSESEEELTVLARSILDAQTFNPYIHKQHVFLDCDYFYVLNTDRRANIFEGSFINLWLNTIFVQSAFSEDEANQLNTFSVPDTINESAYGSVNSTHYVRIYDTYNKYENKVSLLRESVYEDKIHEHLKATQYAISQGSKDDEWWLIDSSDCFDAEACNAGRWVGTVRRSYCSQGDANEILGVVPLMKVAKTIV